MVSFATLITPKKRGIAIFVNNRLVSSLNEYLGSVEFDESLCLKIQLKETHFF